MEKSELRFTTSVNECMEGIYPIEYVSFIEKTLGASIDDIVIIYGIDDVELWTIERDVIPYGFTYEMIEEYPDDTFEERVGVTFSEGFSIGHVEVGLLNGVKVVFDQNASPFGFYMKKSDLEKI